MSSRRRLKSISTSTTKQMKNVGRVPNHRKQALLLAIRLLGMLHVLRLSNILPSYDNYPDITAIRKYIERYIPRNIEEWKAKSNLNRD